MEYECRTCLKVTDNVVELFSSDLPEQIEAISSVPVYMNDRHPSRICADCENNVRCFYEFRKTIIESYSKLEERYFKTEKIEVDEIQIDEIKLEWNDEKVVTNENVSQKEETEQQVSIESNSEPKKVRRKRTKVSKLYKCPKCDFTTHSQKLRKAHHVVHYNEKIICELCGVVVLKKNLRKHIIGLHTETPIACKVCEKVVKNEEILRYHMYSHRKLSLQCGYCEKVYTSYSGYYQHIKHHTVDESQKHACSICGKRFLEKNHLTKHFRSHTGERPYLCQYCNKGFSATSALKTHLRQHTKERPFVCALCDFAFTQKVSLKTHLKSKHQVRAVTDNLIKKVV